MDLIRPVTEYPWARIRLVAVVGSLLFVVVFFWPGWSGAVTPTGLFDWLASIAMAASYLWLTFKMAKTTSFVDLFFYFVVVLPAIGFGFSHGLDRFRAEPALLLRDSAFHFGLGIFLVMVVVVTGQRLTSRGVRENT